MIEPSHVMVNEIQNEPPQQFSTSVPHSIPHLLILSHFLENRMRVECQHVGLALTGFSSPDMLSIRQSVAVLS